jgi:hypothetical protein
VLKLSKVNSVEYAVYDILARDKRLLDVESFSGVLPPLGFIQWGPDHRLIILPRCVILSVLAYHAAVLYMVLGGIFSFTLRHPFKSSVKYLTLFGALFAYDILFLEIFPY